MSDEAKPIDEAEMAELERLDGEGCPAPWHLTDNKEHVLSSQSHPLAILSDKTHRMAETRRGNIRVGNDAALIVAARNALPSLLASVRAARSRAERAERERDEARAELKAMETRPLEDRFPCCGWCVEIFETADEVREHLKTCEKAPYRALAADRDRLREALLPFAHVARSIDPEELDESEVYPEVTIGQVRAARAALEGGSATVPFRTPGAGSPDSPVAK